MALTPGQLPADPLLGPLHVPPLGANVGAEMNREAVSRLKAAWQRGMSHELIAELYESLKRQIESTADDWRADRVLCLDGSVAFVGQVHVLVVHQSGIFVGQLGSLLPFVGGKMTPEGYVFPAPDLNEARRQVC